MSTYTQFIH